MPTTTTPRGYPIPDPAGSDDFDVAGDLGALGTAIAKDVEKLDDRVDLVETALAGSAAAPPRAIYTHTAAQTLPANAQTVITSWGPDPYAGGTAQSQVKVSTVASTGLVTVTDAGLYLVSVVLGGACTAGIRKGGTVIAYAAPGTASGAGAVQVTALVPLANGGTFDVVVYTNNNGIVIPVSPSPSQLDSNIFSVAARPLLSIVRVGAL